MEKEKSPALPRNITGTLDGKLGASLFQQTLGSLRMPNKSQASPIEVVQSFYIEADPQNPLESMLMSQLLAAHTHAMGLLRKAQTSMSTETEVMYTKLSERLMRTFANGLETLGKVQRGGTQSVKVEHVHVNAGGQAVVGNINNGGGRERS